MTRLEQIDFESKEKFLRAVELLFEGGEASRSYKTSDGETKTKKLISKGKLFLGNNLSLSITEADNKKVYVALNYFSVDNRIDMYSKKENKRETEEI